MTFEQWLPVLGYEGLYQVSSTGRVRTLRPAGGSGGGSRPRDSGGALRSGATQDGYRIVALYGHDRRRSMRRVHVLVLEAFHGPRPAGKVAGHMNAVRDDNRVENLRWLTPAENVAQREADGNTSRGERHGRAKVSAADVRAIRAARGNETQAQLARRFGLSPASISFIQSRRNWAHIK